MPLTAGSYVLVYELKCVTEHMTDDEMGSMLAAKGVAQQQHQGGGGMRGARMTRGQAPGGECAVS